MSMRTLLIPVLMLLAGTPALRAQEPLLTARLESVDDLIADAGYLAKLANRDEEANQLKALVAALINDKGLAGVDTKKPIGAYGLVTATMENSGLVGMIPVADEKTFLDTLERLNQRFKKGDDGIYTGHADPYPVQYHFRFANGYCYVAFPDKGILGKPLKPGDVFSNADSSLLSGKLNIDQIPDEFKQIALAQIDLRFAVEQEKERPNESAAEKAFRVATLKETARQMSTLIKEGGRVAFSVDVDPKTPGVVTEFSLAGKSGSGLAKQIAALGKRTTPLAILMDEGSAMNGMIHFTLPEPIRSALAPLIDEEIKKAIDKEPTPAERDKGGNFLEALKPSLKSGELDAGFRVEGPDAAKKYSFLGGVKIQKGGSIDETLRELVKILPKREQKMIIFDALKAPKGVIHRIDIQNRIEKDTEKILGKHPLFVAILPDVAWVAGGPNAEAMISKAVKAQAGTAPQFQFAMSVARLVPTMNRAKQEEIGKIADRVFASGKDKIGVSVKGGAALSVRTIVEAPVIQFFSTLAQRNIDPFDRDPTSRAAAAEKKKDE